MLVLASGAFVLWSQEPVIAGIEPPPRSAFDQQLIERGASLSAIGNCAICHTAPGGHPYAGGRPIPTPFGAVYSTDITPAAGTGIGRWSEAAFRRALRDGVARRGEHLYPAFPYDLYAKLSDDDLHAVYAFMMTRQPAEASSPANRLPFPLDQRWLLPFWNALFVDHRAFRPDAAKSEDWNRGAYLVAGLGHCGDCHTPRNPLGGEQRSRALSGGAAEGWSAPALNAASPALVPWDAAQLFDYLRGGRASEHGAAAGPMRPIVDELAQADQADVRAMAVYIAELQGEIAAKRRQRAAEAKQRSAEPEPLKPAPGEELGATLFAGACADCHVGTAMAPPHGISLALSTAIAAADPTNALHLVLDGVEPSDGHAGPRMPGFAGAFTDEQLVQLLNYVRTQYGNAPVWADVTAKLHDIRSGDKQ